MATANASSVIRFEELRREDVPRVDGKNASLGKMVVRRIESALPVRD